VNPTSGPWQAAHDIPTGVERVVSKKMNLPNFSFDVRCCADDIPAIRNNVTTRSKNFELYIISPFNLMFFEMKIKTS
jgi:hypothetical protein